MDPETEERLSALGYIGRTPTNGESREIDPKDKIHLARTIDEALNAFESSKKKSLS